MSRRDFFYSLFWVSIISALLVFIVTSFPAMQSSAVISWISLVFYILLSILMYNMGVANALKPNKNAFTSIVMGFIAIKLFLSILIVITYIEIARPISQLFVLPFLGIYLIYTIFETYFMMKISKMQGNESVKS